MEGIGVVMPVENSMKKPQHFLGCPGVLNTAMITVIVLYAVIGLLGYVSYGDLVEGSVTLNLPKDAVYVQIYCFFFPQKSVLIFVYFMFHFLRV